MRLVVSGYHGFGNTGDEAILAGMLHGLRAIDGDVEVTVLSGDPPQTAGTHGVKAVPRADPRAVWRALRASDGLISGGGSLLQDRTSARPVAYYTGVMRLARLARRPYAIHAQGLGPVRRRLNRAMAAAALRGAAAVSLRDPDSVALARGLGVRRSIALAPDPALGLSPPRVDPSGAVVVAMREWGREGRHLDTVRRALAELGRDLPVVALPMHEPVDRAASARVVAGIPGASVVGPDASLRDRLAAIASARVVIGMRLHALILAGATGVPAVAISYDPKVDAWARLAGQAVAGDLESGVEPDAVVRAVRDALDADPAPYLARLAELRADVAGSLRSTLAALGAWRAGPDAAPPAEGPA